VHVALAAATRFVLDIRLGPRTLETAKETLATVGQYHRPGDELLLTMDNHRPYPQAILQIFGQQRFRRRRRGRGRRKYPDLKPPPGLAVGIVKKIRDASGNLVRVKTRRLFGRLKDIRRHIGKLKLGQQINTSHVERLNGTLRNQQARLTRRTRTVSRNPSLLQCALWLWRDLYNWTRPHHSLRHQTPAMAQGLSEQAWSVVEYVRYPVHAGEFQRVLWDEERENLLTHGVYRKKPPNPLPIN
jgi:hypothetical protein